jgi:flagellar assembly protein FliH
VRPLPLPELTRRTSNGEACADEAAESVREGHRIGRAIIAQATAQATQIQATAHEQGIEMGRRTALEREGQALRNAVAALMDATARLDALGRELLPALETALPRLAVTIAERILRRELTVRPETLAHVIRDAVTTVLPAARVDIHLHPDDLGTIERYRAVFADALGGAELRLEAAPDVGVGGCFIETESLTLAAGPLQQIERALALLTEAE